MALKQQFARRIQVRIGMTLLEVLLTLSLAVVIAGLIGGAIRTYGREMNLRDLEIRRTQLATDLLRMIENDLVAAMHPTPLDTAPLESFLLAAVGAEAPPDTGGEDLSAAGIEGDSESEDALAVESETLSTGVVLQAPGLIGNTEVIQFDVSRLPRMEEYQIQLASDGRLVDVPSDVKTVAYLVQPPGFIGGVTDPLAGLSAAIPAADDSGGGAGATRHRPGVDRPGGHRQWIDAAEYGGTNRCTGSRGACV